MRTLQQELIDKKLSDGRIREEENNVKAQSKKLKERLTSHDWAEIMGSNKPTFRRAKGGAIRRNR